MWNNAPGSKGFYSSTNYILLGVLLTGFAPEGKQDWVNFDMRDMLGFSDSEYKHSIFKAVGPMNEIGLTAPGESLSDERYTMWH